MDRETRIVMMGKTGSGKSATGNSILGIENFVSSLSGTSITKKCKVEWADRFGSRLSIVDTPGLFDTEMTQTRALEEVAKSIGLVSPGPHAFILVIQPGRFTEEEQKTVDLFKSKFGDGMLNYTIILFTYKSKFRKSPMGKYVEDTPGLASLIASCGNRYMAIDNDNDDKTIDTEVQQLLDMVGDMVRQNGGTYYTNEMLKRVEAEVAKRAEELLGQQQAEEAEEYEKLLTKARETAKKESIWGVIGKVFFFL